MLLGDARSLSDKRPRRCGKETGSLTRSESVEVESGFALSDTIRRPLGAAKTLVLVNVMSHTKCSPAKYDGLCGVTVTTTGDACTSVMVCGGEGVVACHDATERPGERPNHGGGLAASEAYGSATKGYEAPKDRGRACLEGCC